MKHTYSNKYKTQITRTPKTQGVSIEENIRRLTANNEIIPQNVPPIYTNRDDGVLPETDIRTDRFEIAYKAGNKWAASQAAQSEAVGAKPENKGEQGAPENVA